MEEIKKIEEKTNTKIKKFNGKKVVAILLSGAILVGVGYHKIEQKKEIEENKIKYEDVMYDEYTEEDVIIINAVEQTKEYAIFLSQNIDEESAFRAKGLILRLHGFIISDNLDLKNVPIAIGGSAVVDDACEGILFNDLSNRAKLEVIELCKDTYKVLGDTYDFFSTYGDCHGFDKFLEEFYILPDDYVKTK